MKIYSSKLTRFLILFLLLLSVNQIIAVPAYPGMITFTQPNGEKVSIYLRGDEYISWSKTIDGYSLMYNKNGYLEYAVLNSDGNMIPSGIVVRDISKRTPFESEFVSKIPHGIFYSDSQMESIIQIRKIYENQQKNSKVFPTTGQRKLVCILMGFSDLAFTLTQQNFNELFNQVGYSYDNATGSVFDFFYESSSLQLELNVTVAGPYTASNTMAYYGNNTNGDARPLVTEAVTLANTDVNYAEFDNDLDGSVDGVYVIFAGYGEEAGASADAIWSHAWNISTVTLDGKTISRYSCSPEYRGNADGNITRIGVICHEFGHVLGAPDFYDTNYGTGGQYDGTGSWDLQAFGSWNNNGATPAHSNAYTKCYIYNWASPTIISTQQALSILNSEQSNISTFYRYNTATANEYYLFENRQQIGFDSHTPGHGLIVYHVDASYIGSHYSTVNASSHQGMYPMAANATTANGVMVDGDVSTSGCPWPGTSMKTTFTDATTPNSKSWAGANTAKPLINIAENSRVVSLCFITCGGVGDPQSISASAIGPFQIFLSWAKNDYGDNVMVAYNSTNTFGAPSGILSAGDPIPGGGTVLYNGDLTYFKHEGLTPNTQYYYKAWTAYNDNTYSAGISATATTTLSGCSALNYSAAMVQNIPGIYTDLGTDGTEITTSNYDDWNSVPIDLGFTFKYNCEDFTQFILNSNGFIKMGATPPSSASLFFTTEDQPPAGGIFYSTDPADINFISPFNYDLQAGTATPEYRVYTSGSAPYRICTIQYKNVSDKMTAPLPDEINLPTQYNNIQFQIKLYETTNVIDFVYGDWTPSTNASTAKFSGVGLKGSSGANEDLLVGVKGSTGAWSVTTFQNEIYLTEGQNAVNFGNQVGANRPKPDAGRTYRFLPKFDRNLTIRQVYSMGEASVSFGNPQAISANIMNTGYFTLENVTVALNINGANLYSDGQNIVTLPVGQDVTVNFSPFSANTVGTTNINVSIPSDDNNDDNISISEQNTSIGTFNYNSLSDSPVNSLVNVANQKYWVKYHVYGAAKIQSVKCFVANSAVVGSTIYGIVVNSTGTVQAQSPSYTIQSGDLGTWHTFTLSTTPTVTNTDFYVGVNSTTANSSIVVFANEFPVRTATYYTKTSTGTATDVSSKLMIGATLISTTTGEEFIAEESVEIFPNPSNGHLNIVVPKLGTASIFDISGKFIYSYNLLENTNTINVSNIKPGIYFIEIHQGNSKITEKIIIE